MSRRVVWPAVLAFAFGCHNPSDNPTTLGSRLRAVEASRPISLARTAYSALPDPARLVIEDEAAWSVLWADLTSGIYPPPELPAVNFSTHRIIVAAMGARPSAGFVISVDSLVEFEQGSLAFVTSQSPGQRCMNAAVITAPVDVVVVPLSRDPVSFRDRSIVHSCE
jgi:hypothetical protein